MSSFCTNNIYKLRLPYLKPGQIMVDIARLLSKKQRAPTNNRLPTGLKYYLWGRVLV
jgi:hypothetical protein